MVDRAASKFLCFVCALSCVAGPLAGCNRAGARIPGLSGAFPAATTPYQATSRQQMRVSVVDAVDVRPAHYGQRVAGTKWKSVSTDAGLGRAVPQIVTDRLRRDLTAANIFASVTPAPTGGDALIKCEVQAFCSQAVGFLIVRVAGITSLHVTVERRGRVIVDRTFERVVTDADKEYTGSQVTTIEDAMKKTMADSLRMTMADVLKFLDQDARTWSGK